MVSSGGVVWGLLGPYRMTTMMSKPIPTTANRMLITRNRVGFLVLVFIKSHQGVPEIIDRWDVTAKRHTEV
jgi:hypothetical protein